MSTALCNRPDSPSVRPARALVVGDVLVNSWGYEQTNVDYYQVTALVGKQSVEIRAIAKQSEETGSMVGVCTPILDHFTTAPFRKKVTNGGRSVLLPYGYASRKPFELVGGVKTFKPDRWTAYG